MSESASLRMLAEVLVDRDPRSRLVDQLVHDLTAGSLQAPAEELLRVGSYFDIPSADLCLAPRELQRIFNARNEIVHEMDVDLEPLNRNRRQRSLNQIKGFTDEIFKISAALLSEVDKRAADG